MFQNAQTMGIKNPLNRRNKITASQTSSATPAKAAQQQNTPLLPDILAPR